MIFLSEDWDFLTHHARILLSHTGLV